MTEDASGSAAGWADKVIGSAMLAVTALSAYLFELARAEAHGRHFGIAFDAADPRYAAVPLVAIGLLAFIVLATVVLAIRAATVTIPAAAAVIGLGVLALRPFGFAPSLAAAALELACIVAILLVIRYVWRSVQDLPWLPGFIARLRPLLMLPPYVVLLGGALVVIWVSWRLGTYEGQLQAERRTDFDVIQSDASSATVIFTHSGDIVQRVLDITPGPDGKPRNEWRPEVIIRPMPDAGITYRTVRLGTTRPSSVVR